MRLTPALMVRILSEAEITNIKKTMRAGISSPALTLIFHIRFMVVLALNYASDVS